MNKRIRGAIIKLILALGVVWFALACGDSGCSCNKIYKLNDPMIEQDKVYDGVQARITSAGVYFVETNLVDTVTRFICQKEFLDKLAIKLECLTDGSFKIELPNLGIYGVIGADTEMCSATAQKCAVTLKIKSIDLVLSTPGQLKLDIFLEVLGDLYSTPPGGWPDFSCHIPINSPSKYLSATAEVYLDTWDFFDYFDIPNYSLALSTSDFNPICDWWADIPIEVFKGWITDKLNTELTKYLTDLIDNTYVTANCLPCSFYSDGCPDPSSCDSSSSTCTQYGYCRKRPQGVVGSINLEDITGPLPYISPEKIDFFAALGQKASIPLDPVVVNGGLEFRIASGAHAERSTCVPTPPGYDIPSTQPPERMNLGNLIPGKSTYFMAGILVSDTFLDWAIYQIYRSGLLCIELGSDFTFPLGTETGRLASSTFAIVESLNTLTSGREVPITAKIFPGRIPTIEIGANTFTSDGKVLDPLLNLGLREINLDLYVLLDSRWARMTTISLDVNLPLGITLQPNNDILPVLNEDGMDIKNFKVSNSELLSKDPTNLETLINTIVESALPNITSAIQSISIPSYADFSMDVLAIQGDSSRNGANEYIGVYADLLYSPTTFALSYPSVNTDAKLMEIRLPAEEHQQVGITTYREPPEILVEVSSDSDKPVEFSYRVDGGFWRPFRQGSYLTIRSAVLRLPGKHWIELQAREVGNYRTLDPTPAWLFVTIPPLPEEP